MIDVKGKNVVVTGAGSGIGRAAAIQFAKSGANVVVSDINEENAKKVSEEIKELGVKSIYVKTDVGDPAQIKELIEKTVETFGSVDCAVNNAGIGMYYTPLHLVEDVVVDKLIDVNLKSVFYCMKYEIAEMLKQGGGAIVNIASIGGLRGTPGLCLYNATKHGVIGFTKSAAVEYIKDNIHINAICPGPTDTNMFPDEIKEKMAKDIPAGKLAKPEEMGDLAVYLCSDSAKSITGDAIVVDYGMTSIAR